MKVPELPSSYHGVVKTLGWHLSSRRLLGAIAASKNQGLVACRSKPIIHSPRPRVEPDIVRRVGGAKVIRQQLGEATLLLGLVEDVHHLLA